MKNKIKSIFTIVIMILVAAACKPSTSETSENPQDTTASDTTQIISPQDTTSTEQDSSSRQ